VRARLRIRPASPGPACALLPLRKALAGATDVHCPDIAMVRLPFRRDLRYRFAPVIRVIESRPSSHSCREWCGSGMRPAYMHAPGQCAACMLFTSHAAAYTEQVHAPHWHVMAIFRMGMRLGVIHDTRKIVTTCERCGGPPRPGFLEDLKVPPAEWLLHNGASSVLGRELIAMAKRRGTRLINVVRRREAVAELAQLGCARLAPVPASSTLSAHHASPAPLSCGLAHASHSKHCSMRDQRAAACQRSAGALHRLQAAIMPALPAAGFWPCRREPRARRQGGRGGVQRRRGRTGACQGHHKRGPTCPLVCAQSQLCAVRWEGQHGSCKLCGLHDLLFYMSGVRLHKRLAACVLDARHWYP